MFPVSASGYRFPRKCRLLDGGQFQPVFDQPDYRCSGPHFLLLARHNQRPHPRLGLVVGRRRARRAVDRSLIRRLAREGFRLRQHQLAGLDIIILLRAPLRTRDRQALRAELDELWQRLLAKYGQA